MVRNVAIEEHEVSSGDPNAIHDTNQQAMNEEAGHVRLRDIIAQTINIATQNIGSMLEGTTKTVATAMASPKRESKKINSSPLLCPPVFLERISSRSLDLRRRSIVNNM